MPQYLENKVQVPGIPDARAWGDEVNEVFSRFAQESIRQEQAAYGKDIMKQPASILALSGGSDVGAFGAGILCGWTAHGDRSPFKRPSFKLVTGISTGALIAPFAFLGPKYDDTLRQLYTGVTSKDIFRLKLLTFLWRDSIADTKPLAQKLDQYVDEAMVAEVAAEHAKGRRLIIGTTQLDAQRLVLWDMGVIASSPDPEAVRLFRKIMLTSASIPGFFPPQYIRVEAEGNYYEEMHVDGGTTAEVVLYENALKPLTEIFTKKELQERKRHPCIICNSQVKPEWEKVQSRALPIGQRAVATLIKTQGVGDLYRLYAFAGRDNMQYHLAALPPERAPNRPRESFDRDYMKQLFDLGYEMASNGYPWEKEPPGFKSGSTKIPEKKTGSI